MPYYLSTFLLLLLSLPILSQGLSAAAKDSLQQELFRIQESDQLYRSQLEEVQATYGGDSPEMEQLFQQKEAADSLNLLTVAAIIERYGWLGPEEIGSQGSTTLFMVIQHFPLAAQEAYLTLLRTAVQEGKAEARHLAMLEDRVALYQGKHQIYGTQVSWNMKTNAYFVLPLFDPDQVDARRASGGLPPMQEYLEEMDLAWDLEQYKRDLPLIEAAFYQQRTSSAKQNPPK